MFFKKHPNTFSKSQAAFLWDIRCFSNAGLPQLRDLYTSIYSWHWPDGVDKAVEADAVVLSQVSENSTNLSHRSLLDFQRKSIEAVEKQHFQNATLWKTALRKVCNFAYNYGIWGTFKRGIMRLKNHKLSKRVIFFFQGIPTFWWRGNWWLLTFRHDSVE